MTKQQIKKSQLVEVGSEAGNAAEDSTEGFTKRLLMSMVLDVSQLAESTKRLQVQVFTLAKAHGIVPPESSDEH